MQSQLQMRLENGDGLINKHKSKKLIKLRGTEWTPKQLHQKH